MGTKLTIEGMMVLLCAIGAVVALGLLLLTTGCRSKPVLSKRPDVTYQGYQGAQESGARGTSR